MKIRYIIQGRLTRSQPETFHLLCLYQKDDSRLTRISPDKIIEYDPAWENVDDLLSYYSEASMKPFRLELIY